MRIAKTNGLDFLNKIRLNNLKQSSNKLLMLKLIKNLNNLNEKSKEMLGKGALLQPVSKIMLDKKFGGLFDSKGSMDYKNEYLLLSNKLLLANLLNNKNLNIIKSYFNNINSLSKISKNKLLISLKHVRKINLVLNSLKSQFAERNNEALNFIYNNIINNNNKSNNLNLILINKQLSIINNLNLNNTSTAHSNAKKLLLISNFCMQIARKNFFF